MRPKRVSRISRPASWRFMSVRAAMRGRADIPARVAARRLGRARVFRRRCQGSDAVQGDLFFPFKDFVHRRVLVHGRLQGVTLVVPGRRWRPLTSTATSMSMALKWPGPMSGDAFWAGRFKCRLERRVTGRPPAPNLNSRTLNGDALRTELALLPALPSAGRRTGGPR